MTFWTLFPPKRPTLSKTTLDLLLILGLMVLFYGQPLLNPFRMSYGGDGMSLFLPALTHYRHAVFNGVIPLWNSSTWLGAPFLATFQAGVLYPPQILTLFFKSAPAALNFSLFCSLVWLAFGAYFLGWRTLELDRFASVFMAITLGCCGFVGAHTDHVNQLAALSWVPWILAESLILVRRPNLKSTLLLAFFQAMQILAGHPQYVAYTLIYLTGLLVCYCVYFYHRRKTEPFPVRGMACLAAGIVLGLGLASAQILPAQELATLSVRPMDDSNRMFVGSFPPNHLITLLAPQTYGNPATGLHEAFHEKNTYDYPYSEFTCYVGLATPLFALLAVCLLIREFAVRAFMVLTLVSLLIAFGDNVCNGLPYRFLMLLLPGGEGFRVPARFLFFSTLSLAVLAAIGFNQTLRYLSERRRIQDKTLKLICLLILSVVLFDLYLFSRNQGFRFNDTDMILEDRGIVADYLLKHPGEYRVFHLTSEVQYDLEENQFQAYRERKKMGALLQDQRLQPNLNTLWGVDAINGYEEGLLPSLNFRAFIDSDNPRDLMGQFTRNLRRLPPDTQLMGLLNVRYLVCDQPLNYTHLRHILKVFPLDIQDLLGIRNLNVLSREVLTDAQLESLLGHLYALMTQKTDKQRPDRFDRIDMRIFNSIPDEKLEKLHLKLITVQSFRPWNAEQADEFERLPICQKQVALYENLDYLPRFSWKTALQSFCNLSALDVPPLPSSMIPRSVTHPNYSYLLEGALQADASGSTPTLSTFLKAGDTDTLNIKRIAGSPNGYFVEKSAETSDELLMNEAPFPGWVCRWDNESSPLRRVNSAMMGVSVPEGPARLRILYEPFCFRLGLFLSCCFVLAVSCAASFLPFKQAARRGALMVGRQAQHLTTLLREALEDYRRNRKTGNFSTPKKSA
ncbi:MAG TPA: hypothetical protein PLA90_07710 [Candidatus Sumerlaeota bacterium]|nr:hypothetical protein [Candidatus Sumerlaeota bacterium]HPS01413.1 hypothetical protein [Candidatus Sumerlaeota bacterium]